MNKDYELIKFEDGEFSLDVNVSPSEDTVWLNTNQMSMLFERDISVIGKHIRNIFKDDELQKNAVWAKNAYTGTDGKVYQIDYYNLDMIISVGYRVKSQRGILFRRWATQILKQYLLNGYSINDKRCLECQTNIIELNNRVNEMNFKLDNHDKMFLEIKSPDTLLSDKLFYEGDIFDAYSYIKKLFLSASTSITIIDSYIDITVLDMLNDISLPITVYTGDSAHISNQDLDKFSIDHNLTIIRTNMIHDRFIIIDDDIYSIGSSIKDVGKKRFVMVKLESINKDDLIDNL